MSLASRCMFEAARPTKDSKMTARLARKTDAKHDQILAPTAEAQAQAQANAQRASRAAQQCNHLPGVQSSRYSCKKALYFATPSSRAIWCQNHESEVDLCPTHITHTTEMAQ